MTRHEAAFNAEKNRTIHVGMGATMGAGSDSYPYTVHALDMSKNKPQIWVSADDYRPISEGFDYYNNQLYVYENHNQSKPEHWRVFTLCKDGRWHEGTTMKGSVIHVGSRRAYQDPSF
jgi:hypothetical protein